MDKDAIIEVWEKEPGLCYGRLYKDDIGCAIGE